MLSRPRAFTCQRLSGAPPAATNERTRRERSAGGVTLRLSRPCRQLGCRASERRAVGRSVEFGGASRAVGDLDENLTRLEQVARVCKRARKYLLQVRIRRISASNP